jgi:hypothetical protein
VDLVLRRPADPAAATVLVQCKDCVATARVAGAGTYLIDEREPPPIPLEGAK